MSDSTIDQKDLDERLRWKRLDALADEGHLSCIDGRFDDCVVGAPGGDIGELVKLLTAVEETAGVQLESEEIERCVRRLVESRERFYLHTDRAAVDRLEEALEANDETREALERAGSAEALLREPPRSARAPLRDYLTRPEFVGCGHLSTMLAHNDEYAARRELIEAAMHGFFSALWVGRRGAHFVVLEGEHSEEALVAMSADAEVDETTEIPALCHAEGGPSLFVDHPDAQRFVRRQMLEAVAEEVGADFDREAVLTRASELDAPFAKATMGHLAPDLPVVEVGF